MYISLLLSLAHSVSRVFVSPFTNFQSIQMGYIEALVHYVHVGVYSFPKIYSTIINLQRLSQSPQSFSEIQNRFNINVRYSALSYSKYEIRVGWKLSLWYDGITSVRTKLSQ